MQGEIEEEEKGETKEGQTRYRCSQHISRWKVKALPWYHLRVDSKQDTFVNRYITLWLYLFFALLHLLLIMSCSGVNHLSGTSQGNILVFEFQQGKAKELCTFSQSLTAHSFSICDIVADANGSSWASCDTYLFILLFSPRLFPFFSLFSFISCCLVIRLPSYLFFALSRFPFRVQI